MSQEKELEYDLSEFHDLFKFLIAEEDEIIENKLKSFIINMVLEKYHSLFLYLPYGTIEEYHLDQINWSLPTSKEKDIILFINSYGGRIEPAYVIAKICKETSKNKFIVSIPRRAKSAATLISLGADEIHMGKLSELGPIDPQFGNLPALSLSSALECIASLCKRFPETSSMFAEYLHKTMPLSQLGYFERISGSAEHYATRLLENKPSLANIASTIAHNLVYQYKDHGFCIDKDEAKKILGEDIVKFNTEECILGEKIQEFLEKVNLILKYEKNKFVSIVGSINNLAIRSFNSVGQKER